METKTKESVVFRLPASSLYYAFKKQGAVNFLTN